MVNISSASLNNYSTLQSTDKGFQYEFDIGKVFYEFLDI